MAKAHEEHWAFEALRKRLAETEKTTGYPFKGQRNGEPRVLSHTKAADWEHGTIFLFDPQLRGELDETFLSSLYPKVLNEFSGQPFIIPDSESVALADARSGIEAARNAVFLMRDPARPVGTPTRPWWYVRFSLESRICDYMLHTELLLSLPFSVEPDWILDFLVDARSWSIPPSLSVDSDDFVLGFEWGQGRNYLLSEEEWGNSLIEPFRKHIEIAKAVDRYALQPGNRFLKSRMLQLIAGMYGS